MPVGIDADLELLPSGVYDLQIGEDGDIKTIDAFDAAIITSVLTPQRASASEVREPERRRGWIGDQNNEFQTGSKLWLFEQARLTRTVLLEATDAVVLSLQWLVDEGLATTVRGLTPELTSGGPKIRIQIDRPNGKVEERFFDLWENTGRETS